MNWFWSPKECGGRESERSMFIETKQNKTKWNLWCDSEHKQLLQEETWRSALGHKGAWASQGLEQLPGEAAVPGSCVLSYKAAAVAMMVRTPERPRKGLKLYRGSCDLNIKMTVSLYPEVGQAWDNQVTNITSNNTKPHWEKWERT